MEAHQASPNAWPIPAKSETSSAGQRLAARLDYHRIGRGITADGSQRPVPRGPIYPGAVVGRRSADLSLAGGRTTRRGRGRARGTRSICRLCHHPTATVQPVCEPTHTSSKTAGPGRIRLRCPRCRARRSLPDDTHCVEFLQVHEIDLTCPGRNRRPSVTRARVNNCRCSFYVT
jgi:hypothetical protein